MCRGACGMSVVTIARVMRCTRNGTGPSWGPYYEAAAAPDGNREEPGSGFSRVPRYPRERIAWRYDSSQTSSDIRPPAPSMRGCGT